MNRKVLWVIVFALLLGGTGAASYSYWSSLRSPETTPALRGRELAHELGCFACHGPEGTGGVPQPGAAGAGMPGWDGKTVAMFVNSEKDIREWILHGKLRGRAAGGGDAGRKLLIPMPAYEKDLSSRQLADLVAYFRAVSGWAPDIQDEAYEGRKIVSELGCFGCHGPSGMGGVPNPGSLKGHIPPWDGVEFTELVRDDNELREWIMEGRIGRLWDDPVARRFLQRQKIQMPAYRDHLSEKQLELIVAYIRWLRKQ